MKYMGSKNRIAKHILPLILHSRQSDQYYVEPFVGSANMIDKVTGLRIGNDTNLPLIELWKKLIQGWLPPDYITKEEYYEIKNDPDIFPLELVGWVCFCCSFSGKPFSGFAGVNKTKTGIIRNYQTEAKNNISDQIKFLKSVIFTCNTYDEIKLPENSLIYCDPPYKNTTGYRVKFNHEVFYNWCRSKILEGHKVFISEYEMPDDFICICIWSKTFKSSLSQNGMYESPVSESTEKLFVHYSQVEPYMQTI